MGRFQANSYVLSFPVMIVGACLWLVATWTAVATDDLSLVPRAGTILIATGVLSLILIRSFVEPAAQVFEKYFEIYSKYEGQLKDPDSLKEPFTQEQIEQIKRLNEFMRGKGYRGFKRFRMNIPLFELATIFVGTIQTGYGDLLVQLAGGN